MKERGVGKKFYSAVWAVGAVVTLRQPVFLGKATRVRCKSRLSDNMKINCVNVYLLKVT